MGDTHDTAEIDTEPDDFAIAVAAVTRAIRAMNNDQRPGDGGEFITHLIAAVAANLGSSAAVTRSRPGSWEAAGVQDLLGSTVGYDDEYLATHRTAPYEVVLNVVNELDDLGMFEAYEASTDHIGQALFGQRWSRNRGNLTHDELVQIEDIEELLIDLEQRDRADYQQQLESVIRAEFDRRRGLTDGRDAIPQHLTLTVRFTETADPNLTDGWSNTLEGDLYQHARANTPLPGSDLTPEWAPGRSHADQLLDAGHWPHLRIPELAHYGTPTNTTTTEEN